MSVEIFNIFYQNRIKWHQTESNFLWIQSSKYRIWWSVLEIVSMDYQIQCFYLTPMTLLPHAKLFWYFNVSIFYAACMHVQIHVIDELSGVLQWEELISHTIHTNHTIQSHVCATLLLGDGRRETRQQTTSIMACIIEWQQNPNNGFNDHCLRGMFLHPCEIKLIWQSHFHMNYELKTLNLLHCNCLWSFKVTVQTLCIITYYIIYRTLTGQMQK